jgi:hypothetical protein
MDNSAGGLYCPMRGLSCQGARRVFALFITLAASACTQEPSAPLPEPAPASAHHARQEIYSQNKVLILSSSVAGGQTSREALAVRDFDPTTQVVIVTPQQWSAMTTEDFMSYKALIIGNALCESTQAAFQAAIDNRATWGSVVDGNVVILSTDPVSNNTPQLVENAIHFAVSAVNSAPNRTGVYIALGCAYQGATNPTPVTLLEPLGSFKVQGTPFCPDSPHMFEMSPAHISQDIWSNDGLLVGDGCPVRSVFTEYPEQTFAFAALAVDAADNPIPGQKPYIDYTIDMPSETTFIGTPYILVRGAMNRGAGCGILDAIPAQEMCDLGPVWNGSSIGPPLQPFDTCSWSCRNNWCGDGYVDVEFGEECDNGWTNGRSRDFSGSIGACSSFCKNLNISLTTNHPPVAVCQNMTVQATNQCGVDVYIGYGSSDPDGDFLTACRALAVRSTSATRRCR